MVCSFSGGRHGSSASYTLLHSCHINFISLVLNMLLFCYMFLESNSCDVPPPLVIKVERNFGLLCCVCLTIFLLFVAKKNTRGTCRQLKKAKVTWVTNKRITIGYDDRHWAAPTAEQYSALAHDIGHVFWTYCPMQWVK